MGKERATGVRVRVLRKGWQAMKQRPILFSREMVRAIIDQRKTQTRRVIPSSLMLCLTPEDEPEKFVEWCKYGKPSDQLWVKETWAIAKEYDHLPGSKIPKFSRSLLKIWYLADGPKPGWAGRTRAARFMPHWGASRITLKIVKVRVERVQEVSLEDAIAEGVTNEDHMMQGFSVFYFHKLWDEINAKRGFGWDINPWVWVIEFKRVEV
jgi:hypothetical protein